MHKLLGLIAGLVAFVAWISVVGNPHVVETAIGLCIAVFCGWWVYSKSNNLFGRKQE